MQRATNFFVVSGFCLLALTGCGPQQETETSMEEQPVAESAEMPQAEAADPGLIHTVYFWLNEGLSEEEHTDFETALASLEEVPSVSRLFIGPPASTPSRGVVDNSFDYALIVWFDDVAGHDAYQVDPVHLAFVEGQEAKFKEVKVYDNFLK